MKNKYRQLIEYLINHNGEYISSLVLAEALNVTDRSIRNYIKEINSNISNGVMISSSQLGYKIIATDSEHINEKGEFNESNSENKLLEFQIIQFLLNNNNYTSYDEIANKFFYSPQTIRSRIQKLVTIINELGLKVIIDTKVFKGIKLIGSEVQKRILLEMFFTNIFVKKEMFKDFVIKSFDNWIEPKKIEKTFRIFDKVNTDLELNLEFLMYKKIITQLIIMAHQVNNQKSVEVDKNQLEEIKIFKEYEVALKIKTELNELIFLDDREFLFLVNYLISLQLDLGKVSSDGQDSIILSTIHSILEEIESVYNIETFSEKRFRNSIADHIYRIIHPASQNILIYNPHVKEAKSEYIFSFSIASNIALKLENIFHLEVRDSEIAYLAYHIQVILESQDKKKTKTVILYSRNYERSKLLSSKLITYFDELEIIAIEKYTNNFKFHEENIYVGINLVNVPLKIKNFINLGSSFRSNDIKKINFFLESQKVFLEKATIHWLNADNPKEIIKKLLVIEDQEIMLDSILKREEMSSTSIGNLVAIPHPYIGKSEYKEKIIIAILNQEVIWGKEAVQLVLVYIPSSDTERNEFIFQEFYKKTKDITEVKKLIKTNTKEQFIIKWNEI